MTTKTTCDLVAEFHREYGFGIGDDLVATSTYDGDRTLSDLIGPLMVLEKKLLESWFHDQRVFRIYLIVEELRELVEAFRECDVIETCDALGDLRYVVDGTAVTFGFPLEALVEEIHRSNMLKQHNKIDGKPEKGPGWLPPDIARVLGL